MVEAEHSDRPRSGILKSSVSLVSVAAAIVAAKGLHHYWQAEAYASLFFCAIIFSAGFGGYRQGLLATALSVLAFDYWFLPPIGSLWVNSAELPRLIFFLLCALMVGFLAASQRHNTASLRRARDDLAVRIADLKNINELLNAENAQRRLAEAALQRNEEKLEEAQRIAHVGHWERDLDTDANSWSNETYRIFGLLPQDQVPGLSELTNLLHPDDRPKMIQAIADAVNGVRPYDVEYRVIRPDGEVRFVHSRGGMVKDESGRPRRRFGTVEDITERKRAAAEREQAEAALRQAQADLAHVSRLTTMGELTASIAHEVNQPLAAVVNNAHASLSLLPKDTRGLQEVREALTEIIEDANRASDIIERVRRLAKRVPVEKSRLDLSEVVNDVLGLARYGSTMRQVTIRTDLSTDLPPVSGDRVQLQQVLLNLVINGMDAMDQVEESKRVLTICGRRETREGASEALLSVSDSGVGLKPQAMERLFEAFYTTKTQGMGMGLTISRSIIEAHGGRMWAETRHGPGATFIFSLPSAPSAGS
jgi:PAS domain S-box-containing protein